MKELQNKHSGDVDSKRIVIIHDDHAIPTKIEDEDGIIKMRRWDVVGECWGAYTEWRAIDIKKFLSIVADNDTFPRTIYSRLYRRIYELERQAENCHNKYCAEVRRRLELEEQLKELQDKQNV